MISAILHPATLLLIWCIVIILAILGINLDWFSKPKPKVKDIEFVLVDKEQTPLDKTPVTEQIKTQEQAG